MTLQATTRRISLTMGGQIYDNWTSFELTRDMSEISGGFRVELRDATRHTSFPWADLMDAKAMVVEGLEVTVALDGKPVLKGWIDDIAPRSGGGQASVSVTGRDKTCDLIDCAATVNGPWEYRNQKVDQIVSAIVKPFGLTVRADVDVGEAIDRIVLEPGETAMSAIEKACRMRQLLVTSDGLGGIVLTRGGKGRAPAALRYPNGNVVESAGSSSMRQRFSEYHVVAQAEKAGGRRKSKPAKLDVTAHPLGEEGAGGGGGAGSGGEEAAGTKIVGTAKDSGVKRYRPHVALARTQCDAKTAQKQADWMERTARSAALKYDYVVRDYGANGQLWRPNELTMVEDDFQNLARDLLIAGLVYAYGAEGAVTRLRVTGPEAFDTEPEGPRTKNHKRAKGSGSGKLDTKAEAL